VGSRVKNAIEYIGDYEKALVDEARRREIDGVICGHIHSAEIRPMEGVLYCATTAIGSNPAQCWSNWREASYG
jgi:UDP-2,3-diacylglucosamine pyrophosphatase LpxH